MKKCVFTIFSLTVVIFSLSISSSFSQDLTSNQIDSLVESTMKTIPNQAGIAITVVKDGNIIHSKGYGVNSINSKQKTDENTLFAIASNSKAFTAAALAILVDDGKIGWNDRVIDHVPEFRMYNPYLTANFTIIDLLTHRSGLGLGAGDLMIFPDGSDFTIDDVLKSFQYQQPVSDFRTKFDYDNLLYIVAGEVVNRVSGMDWTEFVENRIMQPLGMERSAATINRLNNTKNVAMPHSSDSGDLIEIDPFNQELTAAAGGIYSSVTDLSKWILVQLNKGKYGADLNKTLFTEARQKEMWQPYTTMSFSVYTNERYRNHFSSYGLGWNIMNQNGYIIIQHTGGLPGMLSQVSLIPELNAGVVVLTNSFPGGGSYYTLSQSIIDSFIGVKPKDWIGEMASRLKMRQSRGDSITSAVWEESVHPSKTELNLENYTGVYEDPWFGKVEVFLKGNNLWMKSQRSPKLNGEMLFYKATTFAVDWEYEDMPCDAFATFILDEEGKATGIKMKGISPYIDFSFDFQHLNLQRVSN
jgi:CubicO group peptidase (beta-lactamase class C family)